MKIQAPKGTKDLLPSEAGLWRLIESAARDSAELFGFGEIRFPVFEHSELFLRGIGEDTDVVQKEMYTFTDKGGRSVTLRPEGTASVVRALIEHGLYAEQAPQSFYYIAPNFRYEKPAAGRLRQHHQFGAELFGVEGAGAETEVIGLACALLNKLGVDGVTLNINSIGCRDCRKTYLIALSAFLDGISGSLCPTCLERRERNPMRVLDCKVPECIAAAQNAPSILNYLCGDCRNHFQSVKRGLGNIGASYSIDPRIVRGLDYYTRTVFEFLAPIAGEMRAVIAGGRYDHLVESLGGPAMCGIGFGCGIERMALLLGGKAAAPSAPSLFLCSVDTSSAEEVERLCSKLRALGVSCRRDICNRSLKAQMKYADKSGAQWCGVVGETEINTQKITLKHMRDKISCELPLDSRAISVVVTK